MHISTKINKPVFISSLIIAVSIALFAALQPNLSNQLFNQVQNWLVSQVSWLYILSVAIFLIFIVCVMVSRLGDIKLGPDHSEPDYSNISWFSMLFSAGMGIGLMFFGVAEPVMHYLSPPVGDPATIDAAKDAMRITFFHWGLHAWGIYAIVALALAYFSYRHKLPLLPRSALYPIIGERIHGPIGHATDTFAVVGTLFGVATSLGFGVQQLNAGLSHLFAIEQTVLVQLALIVVITILATISVILGLDGGIKRLSNLNMFLALALLVGVLLLGPTAQLFQSFVENTGTYMSELVNSTFNMYAYDHKEDWLGGWTMLYWGWWVSWSPFVGTFIARVSRGRTIREFIVGVLFIPSGFTFLWMTVFGNSAIDIISSDTLHTLAQAVNDNVAIAIFVFFEQFPLASLLSLIAVLLVTTFFITSADSGALVIDTLTAGGEQNTPVWQRIFWTAMIGIIASALLYAGGLQALQTLTIASAFPFMFVMLLFCYGLFKALRHDLMLQNSVQNHNTSVQFAQSQVPWQERLNTLLVHPRLKQAESFIESTVRPALTELCEQFKKAGINAKLIEDQEKIRLTIYKEEAENFSYGIRLRHFVVPTYADEKHDDYYRAEVFLLQGGQQYDVFGYTQEQIIADAITQYERHLHFLYLASSEILEEEAAESLPQKS
ncbi:BCCT family transporter [Motilimonas eburnea]|uniref:BCCT family transporter n=1 Tax=Motilimonas eburnea TaxID=1737488 RepID=UPI001E429FE3|nr:BCCT family transporter [Motilimonas eburnea]MCE2569874.1 BCCT family transporter [Motilimonas eburnea]